MIARSRVEISITVNESPCPNTRPQSGEDDGRQLARERARVEEDKRGAGWVGSSTPAGFRVHRLGKLDVHRLNGLFAPDRQVSNQKELFAAFFDVRLHAVMGAPGLFQDDHRNRRFRFAVRTG